MRCALVLLSVAALEGISPTQVSGAPGSTVVPSHASPANLAGISKLTRRRYIADVGISSAISKPGACARRPVQSIRPPRFVLTAAADTLLLCTRPPRPCAPSCWLERLQLLECA